MESVLGSFLGACIMSTHDKNKSPLAGAGTLERIKLNGAKA